MSIESQLPAGLQSPVAERLQAAAGEHVVRRLWERDGTLWAPPGTPEVTDRLGWLDIAERLSAEAGELKAFGAEVRDAGITDAVLLGMGGSSLGPEVLRRSFGEGAIRLHVLDSTHPDEIRRVRDALDLATTLFIVSSKSGGTIETMSQFKYFHSLQGDGAHYVAVTDPGTSLAQLGAEHGFRRVFENDPDIGGRYSVLSYFGLVPAAIAGYDVGAVLASAVEAMEACRAEQDNPGLELGVALGELARRARDKLTFVVDEPLESFGLWAEQLVAESTGKLGRGILPIADEPLVPAAEYGDDRVFLHVSTGDVEVTGKVGELTAAGHPVFTLDADGPADLGRIFFLLEFATAVAGWVLGINPFDQPNVQEAKDNTQRVLDEGCPRARGRRRRPPARPAGAAALSGDHGLPAVLVRRRGRRRAPARAHRARPPHGDDVRLRPALPALHGAVPQGRPGGRGVPADRRRAAGGHPGPRRAVHVRHPDPRAGRRRPSDTALPRPGCRAG